MFFREVTNYFNEIEQSSSRLKIIDLLGELFEKTSPEEVEKVVYLIQGRIAPKFDGKEIGFGEKLIIQGISKASGFEKKEVEKVFNKTGDLGDTAEEFIKKKKQLALVTQELTIEKVFSNLKKMSESEGEGSQELKIKLLAELFNYATPLEAKYIARIPLGNIRLGIGDPTIMDAFANNLTSLEQKKIFLTKKEFKTKTEEKKIEEKARKLRVSAREKIEAAYNIDSDLGRITKLLKEKGLGELKKIRINPGTPIRPTAAERLPNATEIINKLGECVVEAKYDGFRLQVSKKGNEIKIFSRQSEEVTQMFPEIIQAFREHINASECIVEGEALAYNEETQEYYPFQVTIQRKRKYEVEKKAKEYPLNLFLFDIMYLNERNLLGEPLRERRRILEELVSGESLIKLSEQKNVSTPKELEDFFEDAVSRGLEGVIAKDLNAPYIAGARKFSWIKLKRTYKGTLMDTLDLVILGYYSGKGKRTEFGLGALLVGTYNKEEDVFESIAKIGTGLSEENLSLLQEILSKKISSQKPARVISEIEPDYWVEPTLVIEVMADEITMSPIHACCKTTKKGFALRFPRMIKIRGDKNPVDATTSSEVKELFELQRRVQLEE